MSYLAKDHDHIYNGTWLMVAIAGLSGLGWLIQTQNANNVLAVSAFCVGTAVRSHVSGRKTKTVYSFGLW